MKGIPFHPWEIGPMREGLKTQLRRIIKPQPKLTMDGYRWEWKGREIGIDRPIGWILLPKCPFPAVGERFFVKETWQDYCPLWKGAWCGCGSQKMIEKTHKPAYKATPIKGHIPLKWKPSNTMPEWASRLFGVVKRLWVERIGSISDDDCIANGIDPETNDDWNRAEHAMIGGSPIQGGSPERFAFISAWDTTYAKKGHGFDKNEFVWCMEFEKTDRGL